MKKILLMVLVILTATYHDFYLTNGVFTEVWSINGSNEELLYFIELHRPRYLNEKLIINLPNETLEIIGDLPYYSSESYLY